MSSSRFRARKFASTFAAVTVGAGSLVLGLSSPAQAASAFKFKKSATSPTVANTWQGSTLSWQLEYSCVSLTGDCTNTVITDKLPPGVTFASAESGGVATGNNVVWNLGTLVSGSGGLITVTGTVPCDTATASYNNSADIIGDGVGATTKTAAISVTGASTCTPPPPPPFGKSGPAVLNPDGRAHYGFKLPALAKDSVMVDVLPAGLDYVNAYIPAPIAGEVSCDGGSTWIAVDSSGTPASPCPTPNRIRFHIPKATDPRWKSLGYGAPYAADATVRMHVPATTAVPSTINNDAKTYEEVNGVIGTTVLETGATTGNVAAGAPMTEIGKYAYKLPGQKDSYNTTPAGQATSVSDDVAYQIYYGNDGGGNAAGKDLNDPVITDLLDVNTDYVTGQNWYTVSGPTGCDTPTFETIPNFGGTGRTLLRWKFVGCTLLHNQDYNGRISINFTARMRPGLNASTNVANDATGQETSGPVPQFCDQTLVADTLDVDGDGSTTDLLCKAPFSFAMPKLATFDSQKWVNGAADPAGKWSRFPDVGKTSVVSDGYATYRLFVKPNGNVDTSKIELSDVLPHVGDTGVNGTDQPRLSGWGEILAGPLELEYLPFESLPAGPQANLNLLTGWSTLAEGGDYQTLYSHNVNPCVNDANDQTKFGTANSAPAGCVNDWDANSVAAKAFSLNITKSLRKWSPAPQSGDLLRITVRVKESGSAIADVGQIAWNSFALTPTDTSGQEFLTAEPRKVGVTMTADPALQPSLGDYVWYDENKNGQQDAFEEGFDGVLVSLYDPTGNLVRSIVTGPNPADPTKHGFYRFDGLNDTTAYTIKLDRGADLAAGGPLAGFVLTSTDSGPDATDNDATLVGVVPTIASATTGAGSNHNPTYDFGFWKAPAYSIGNRVWLDDDNSGKQEAGEPAVDNVLMNLFKKNADGTSTKVGSDTTQGGGYYRFDGLNAGDYYVQVDPTNFAIGGPLEGRRSSTGAGQNADPNTDIDLDDNGIEPATSADYTALGDTTGVVSGIITLGPGKTEPLAEADLSATGQGADDNRANMTVDFGFITPKFAVGNYVWEDANNDGLQGASEAGINDVTVTLFKNGTQVSQTSTQNGPDGKAGFYLFDDLLAGNYYVVFAKPIGTEFTKQTIGADKAIDSNADPVAGATQGRTAVFTLDETLAAVDAAKDGANLKAAYVLRTIDAGISKRYSLGNIVWNDANNDSKITTGEAGIDGVKVELHKANVDGTPGALVSDQLTTDGGHYLFTNLDAGDYIVVIPSGQVALKNFNSSATTTSGEAPAAPANGDIDNDDNGTKVAAGDVVSSVVTLGGVTDEPTGEPETIGHTDATPDAQSNATVDFGFYSMSLGNLVWEDTNNNGTRNDAEPVIAGVKVFLFLDNNADGKPDGAAIATTTTDANGQYLFAGLAAGKYVVEIEAPVGMYSSSGIPGSYAGPFEPGKGDDSALDTQDHGTTVGNRIRSATIMLIPGNEPLAAIETDGLASTLANPAGDANTDLTVDFGLVPGASIGNYVWIDTNRDGIQNEPIENGLNGIKVNLVDSKGNVVKTTTTSTDATGSPGYYRFDVIPGDYKVTFDLTTLPEGFKVSPKDAGANDSKDSDADPATGMTTLTTLDANENDPNWDLGVYPLGVVVGNYVWLDANNDGIQNDGPTAGFAGVKVTICDAAGNPVTVDVEGKAMSSTTTTDASGQYLFSNLKPGIYKVKFEAPAGYEATVSNAGADTAADSNGLIATSKNLPAGQSDLTLDLGLVKIVVPRTTTTTAPTTTAPATTAPTTTAPTTVAPTTVAPTTAAPTVTAAPATTVAVTRPATTSATTSTPTVPAATTPSTTAPSTVIIFPPVETFPTTAPTSSSVVATPLVPSTTAAAPTTSPSPSPTSPSPTATPTTGVATVRPQTIRGQVFLDNNRSLDREGSEPGKGGVIVRLLDTKGNVVATTSTDDNGNYGFAAEPGDYVIEILKPEGLNATTVIRRTVKVLAGQVGQQAADFGLASEAVDLAFTGRASSDLALWGSFMLTTGMVLLALARRRREN